MVVKLPVDILVVALPLLYAIHFRQRLHTYIVFPGNCTEHVPRLDDIRFIIAR